MLTDTAYGKSSVRIVQIARRTDRDDLADLTVAIRFEGDYDESYTAGDNSGVLPTDTMKNTVYALAAPGPIESPEAFGLILARHFLDRNTRLDRVTVDLVSHAWRRIDGHAFERQGPETRTARVTSGRAGATIDAGLADLVILKSSKSAFAGYLKDEWTTLPETRDRIFATSLSATWRYQAGATASDAAWQAARAALVETFAAHDSASVQHTMYAMGQAVLARVAGVESIRLVMPNKHHLPVDLSRLGLPNKNEIFVPTDEPHGLIEATVTRA